MPRAVLLVVAACVAAIAASTACGDDPSSAPSPTSRPVDRPSPLELYNRDETDAVLVGRIVEQFGPNSAHDDGTGGVVYRRWRIELIELLKGSVAGRTVLVRVDTHSLGTPIPPSGMRSGTSTGAPEFRVGEEVLVFLTRNAVVPRPVSYPPLAINEFMLVGPNVGKWLIEGGRIRCDDPAIGERLQADVSREGTLSLLRQRAGER